MQDMKKASPAVFKMIKGTVRLFYGKTELVGLEN